MKFNRNSYKGLQGMLVSKLKTSSSEIQWTARVLPMPGTSSVALTLMMKMVAIHRMEGG